MARSGIVRWAGPSINQRAGRKSPRSLKSGKVYPFLSRDSWTGRAYEVVPIKRFADEMSTGVSYFEQFVWDLEHRGVADIDIPVLVLGVVE